LVDSDFATAFDVYLSSLVRFKNRTDLDPQLIIAELIKERAYHKDMDFDAIMQTELILYMRCLVHPSTYSGWYPRTLVYAGHRGVFDLFAKAKSARHFEGVKTLLGIKDKQELLEKFEAAEKRGGTQFGWTFRRVSFAGLANLENLDTLP
jgi:hypothetical protein